MLVRCRLYKAAPTGKTVKANTLAPKDRREAKADREEGKAATAAAAAKAKEEARRLQRRRGTLARAATAAGAATALWSRSGCAVTTTSSSHCSGRNTRHLSPRYAGRLLGGGRRRRQGQVGQEKG